jgi:DNA-binding Xre family transcriptional regulator
MILWKLDDVMRRKKAKGREMARRMGIGENYLSRVRHEVPDRLSLTLLDALCHELDCTIADLLEYQPGPMPEPAPPPPPKPPVSAKKPSAPRKPLPKASPQAQAAQPAMPELVAPAPTEAAVAGQELAPAPEAAPAPAPVSGMSLAQRRAREAIRQGLEAPQEEAPAPTSEETKAGAAVVRTSALQAKLARLRKKT